MLARIKAASKALVVCDGVGGRRRGFAESKLYCYGQPPNRPRSLVALGVRFIASHFGQNHFLNTS